MNRQDLTYLKPWVIDPKFCTDRDDAFALSKTNSDTTLWLFVADPTEELVYNSYFHEITKMATTKYFIDKLPIHLFHEHILEKYSLDIGKRQVICIKVVFDNIFNIKSQEIFPATIDIKETFVYQDTIITDDLYLAIKISDILFNKRKSSGKVLRDYKIALPVYLNDKWVLHLDDTNTNKLKNMIAEFAILANQIVAEKLNINFNRICGKVGNVENVDNPVLFMENLIKNNQKASYKISNEKHYLIDDKVYTHFTSPLRRKSDCIVHFLLKGIDIPLQDLIKTCNDINEITKNDKKRNYNEIKKYTFIAMKNINKPVLNIKVLSRVGKFVNMLIYKINEFPVQISVTIVTTNPVQDEYQTIIQYVNLNGKHDSDILIGLEVVNN